MKEKPLSIKLLAARPWQPSPYSPTSGCTQPACITHRETELNALGAICVATGAYRSALRRAHVKISESKPAQETWEEKTWD